MPLTDKQIADDRIWRARSRLANAANFGTHDDRTRGQIVATMTAIDRHFATGAHLAHTRDMMRAQIGIMPDMANATAAMAYLRSQRADPRCTTRGHHTRPALYTNGGEIYASRLAWWWYCDECGQRFLTDSGRVRYFIGRKA